MNCVLIDTGEGPYCHSHRTWHTRTEEPVNRINVGITQPMSAERSRELVRQPWKDSQ